MRKFHRLAPVCAVIAAVVGLVLAPGQAAYAEPTVAALEAQIEQKSTELEKVVEQYNQLNEQLKATQAQIATLEQAIPVLKQRAAVSQGKVADLARTAYKTTGISGMTAVLSSESGSQTLLRLGALRQLALGQQRQIAEANAGSARHVAATRALTAETAEAGARLKTIGAQRAGIEAELGKLNELKIRARGTVTSGSNGGYTGPIPEVSGKAGIAVTFAYQAIGKPYGWADDGPDGYDCSGLTLAAWRAAGVSLAHYTVTQWNQTARISRSQLAAGDLVFYSGLGHVGLYVGDNKVIHAPTFGDYVKISSIDMMPPYGYGRVQ